MFVARETTNSSHGTCSVVGHASYPVGVPKSFSSDSVDLAPQSRWQRTCRRQLEVPPIVVSPLFLLQPFLRAVQMALPLAPRAPSLAAAAALPIHRAMKTLLPKLVGMTANGLSQVTAWSILRLLSSLGYLSSTIVARALFDFTSWPLRVQLFIACGSPDFLQIWISLLKLMWVLSLETVPCFIIRSLRSVMRQALGATPFLSLAPSYLLGCKVLAVRASLLPRFGRPACKHKVGALLLIAFTWGWDVRKFSGNSKFYFRFLPMMIMIVPADKCVWEVEQIRESEGMLVLNRWREETLYPNVFVWCQSVFDCCNAIVSALAFFVVDSQFWIWFWLIFAVPLFFLASRSVVCRPRLWISIPSTWRWYPILRSGNNMAQFMFFLLPIEWLHRRRLFILFREWSLDYWRRMLWSVILHPMAWTC